MSRSRWSKSLHKVLVFFLIGVLALVPVAAFAQDDMMPTDEDLEAVQEALDGLLDAWSSADAEALDELTAENFIWVDTDGEVLDRDAWLASAAESPFSEMTASDVTMTPLAPDLVGVLMHLDGVGEWDGQEFAIFETDSLIFVRADDTWQVALVHGTERRAETDAYWATAAREQMFAALPVLTIDVSDEGIVVPEEVLAGPTLIELTNSAGTVDEEGSPILADVGVLVEGATVDDLLPLLETVMMDPAPALELLKLYGLQIVPGGRLVWDLQPGENLAITTVGEPLTQSFTVVEGDDDPAEMTADVEVSLVDFAFEMPEVVASGPQVWQIENAGSQWHEIIVLKLQEGMTSDDLLMMFAGEGGPPGEEGAMEDEAAADDEAADEEAADDEAADDVAADDEAEEGAADEESAGAPEDDMPFELVYGYVTISEGNTAWVELDLPPGEYTVICFLPDLLSDMSPHAAHGMVRSLTVTE